MKNQIRFALTLTLVFAFVLATGVTSASAEGNVKLLGARFVIGKGLLVTFSVPEDVDLDQSAGVTVNGVTYPLVCRVSEISGKSVILACIANVSKKSVGGQATIWFGSASFSELLKDPRPWCYSVFDYGLNGKWDSIGQFCQVTTVGLGAIIVFFNPDYGTDFDYIYGPDDSVYNPNCGPDAPNFGDGFYYEC